ncbi:MAG: MmcQ/YjbR family DNA-binding protein [Actinomycetota bacterium]|nr:MmcQ/YjbR family DNA-binding protein [Actinomycetota bacterium]
MTARQLRALCLALPGAREEFPFRPNLSVFKVGPKMFALSALAENSLRVSVKCEPELGADLRASYPSITPGYHLNKRHWLTVAIDGSIPDTLVRDLVEGSYELVVDSLPRARKRALDL